MEINDLLIRKELKENIISTIHNISNNLNEITQKKVIYLMGSSGSGKSYFMNQILKELDYDIVPFDTEQNRNSSNFDFIKSHNLSSNNVLDLLKGNRKKICILMDNLESLNTSDKSGLGHLIKLLRPKKTLKQKKEDFCKNLIIIISNVSNDKKILELQKICYNFNFPSPNNIEISNIINHNFNNVEKNYKLIIQNFVANDLKKLVIIYKLYISNNKNNLEFYKIIDNLIENFDHMDAKFITGKLISEKIHFNNHDLLINDSDRTIISLLFHENIIDYIKVNNLDSLKIYNNILSKFCTGDYYDKITFQKQIWLFNELTSLIKNISTNYILSNTNNQPLKNELEEIRFTKILTKYSTEFNNINFVIKLCQKLGIDKKDLLNFFQDNYAYFTDKDYSYFEERYEIKKLDIVRLIRYIENKTSKEFSEENINIE